MIKEYMPKERKVYAIQWDGKNLTDLINFVGKQLTVIKEKCINGKTFIRLNCKNGTYTEVNLKDFIVKEVNETFEVYTPDNFKKRYTELNKK